MTRPNSASIDAKRARVDVAEECYKAQLVYRKAQARARRARERELDAARSLAIAEERYARAVDTHREALGLAPAAQLLEEQT